MTPRVAVAIGLTVLGGGLLAAGQYRLGGVATVSGILALIAQFLWSRGVGSTLNLNNPRRMAVLDFVVIIAATAVFVLCCCSVRPFAARYEVPCLAMFSGGVLSLRLALRDLGVERRASARLKAERAEAEKLAQRVS